MKHIYVHTHKDIYEDICILTNLMTQTHQTTKNATLFVSHQLYKRLFNNTVFQSLLGSTHLDQKFSPIQSTNLIFSHSGKLNNAKFLIKRNPFLHRKLLFKTIFPQKTDGLFDRRIFSHQVC